MEPSRSGNVSRSAGASRVGCLVGLVILILGGYVAVLFIGSEIDFRQLQSEVRQQAALAAELDDQEIREAIAAQAAELQLPAAAGRVTIRRLPVDRIEIVIQYPDRIDVFGRWQWVRNRRIQIDQAY